MDDMWGFVVIIILVAVGFLVYASNKGKSSSTFSTILDKYQTLDEVEQALRRAGLESCNLIVGIDFTKSNSWQGERTFGGRNLHDSPAGVMNPYQSVIDILGRTLANFDDDNLIPAYGFGDETTRDRSVFPLHEGNSFCRGFEEVLARYVTAAATVKLAGPTSFAPLVQQAVRICQEHGGFHILVIIADGQVTNRRDTVRAIVEASHHPLAIIMVGVGDGPWEMMMEFDDELPQRRFDNFQFVPFDDIMRRAEYPESSFALNALMEIPDAFQAVQRLGLM